MPETKEPIRALIVEDEGLFRDMLYRTLAGEERLEVVGAVEDGESAVRLARELSPHVVLMDIELPGQLNGIQAGLQIKEERPETGIILLSAHKDKEYIANVPLAQASGWSYLLKQSVADVSTLIRAIEGSASGLMVLDPEVVAGLKPREGSRLAKLTHRQLDVLELIAQGHNNAAVAATLHLGEKSVENYINAIYQELHLSDEETVHPRVRATLIFLQETRNRSGTA